MKQRLTPGAGPHRRLPAAPPRPSASRSPCLKRFGEHGGGRLSATISYYAFFSLFPLLLVFVTILGLVLQDNPSLRDDLVDGALGQIPVIGSQLKTDTLPGQGWVLAVGLVTALWAGWAR